MKNLLFASSCIIALSIMACSQSTEEKTTSTNTPKAKFRKIDPSSIRFHGDMDTSTSALKGSPVLEELKNNHLEVSSTKTIGAAFDAYKYATKTEWRESASENGPYYIDYICWVNISPVSSAALKEGVVKRALEIKFVIHRDGETYIAMASRVDIKSDGMMYTTPLEPTEIKKNVTAIYENREIPF